MNNIGMKWIRWIQGIGIDPQCPLLEVKRIRMLNHVALCQAIFYSTFTIISLFSSRNIFAWGPNFLGILVGFTPILLNAAKKHKLAKFWSSSIIPIFITFCVFIWGTGKQTHLYILFHSIFPVLFFDRLKDKLWVWVLTVFLLSICLASPFFHTPVYTNAAWPVIAVMNNYGLFLSFFLFIIFNENNIDYYITEIKQTNLLLKESHISIEKIHKSQKKLNFIISHDLKNYIAVQQSMIKMYIRKKNEYSLEHQDKILNEIKKAIDTCNELVSNLMDLSKSNSGLVENNCIDFNLNNLLIDVKRQLAPFTDMKNIRITSNICKSKEVHGDPNAYMTILRNLILNAVKFSEHDSTIDIRFDQDEQFYHFRVCDTGIGMREEDRRRIFRNGTDYRTIGTSKEKGTGLGLSICHEIIKQYMGRISVEHNQPKGCIFHFSLPVVTTQYIQDIQAS